MAESPPGGGPEATPTAAKPAFKLVRDFGARAAAINDLFNGFTGRVRSLQEYGWEWLSGVPDPGHMWAIVDQSTDRVVGMHGIIHTPLVRRGESIAGGHTENTVIDPAVRRKIFYPAMERKALREASETLAIIYTVHGAGPQREVRFRLGYKIVGRWGVYIPRMGGAYLGAALERACARLAWRVPRIVPRVAGQVVAGVLALGDAFASRTPPLEVSEVDSLSAVAEEYERFWEAARRRYDLTVDRSLAFMRWRFDDNPNLQFRTWTLRAQGQLRAVVIGHTHRIGAAPALYVDDIIVGDYDEAAFDAVLRSLRFLDPRLRSIVLILLGGDTPLQRVLRRRLPLQSWVLGRFGHRMFDELLAHKRDDAYPDEPWYVTAIVTEGLDTSQRSQLGPRRDLPGGT